MTTVGTTTAPSAGKGIFHTPRSSLHRDAIHGTRAAAPWPPRPAARRARPWTHTRRHPGPQIRLTTEWPINAHDSRGCPRYDGVEIAPRSAGRASFSLRPTTPAAPQSTVRALPSPPSDIAGLLAIDRHAATGRIEFMHETGWRGELALTSPVVIFADHVQISWRVSTDGWPATVRPWTGTEPRCRIMSSSMPVLNPMSAENAARRPMASPCRTSSSMLPCCRLIRICNAY